MSNKEVIYKLFILLKGYKTIIITIIICLLFSTGLSLCIPLLSKRIMDDGFIGENYTLLTKLVLCSFFMYLINTIINLIKEKNVLIYLQKYNILYPKNHFYI